MTNRTNPNTYTNPGRRRRQPRWGRILGVLVALAVVIAAAALVPQMLHGGQSTQPGADNQNTGNAAAPNSGANDSEWGQDAPDTAVENGALITLRSEEQAHLRAYSDAGFYYLTQE